MAGKNGKRQISLGTSLLLISITGSSVDVNFSFIRQSNILGGGFRRASEKASERASESAAVDIMDHRLDMRPDVAGGFLEPVLDMVHKSVNDVFPSNRIYTKCASCGRGISRYKGYVQRQVGNRGTLCFDCQKSRGLPVRENDD